MGKTFGAGWPTVTGPISGSGGICIAGSGLLTLSNTSSNYSGGLTVGGGTLCVPAVNNTYSSGPLGSGNGAVALGTATLEYTGTSATSNRFFTLASGGVCVLQIDNATTNLGISNSINGGGSLQKTGPGMLTLSGSNGYSGSTQVSSGTLAIDTTGSINGTSAISIAQKATLDIANSGSSQTSSSANVTLSGGNLVFTANGGVNGGATAGALILGSGQSSITASRTGGTAYTPAITFSGSPPSGAAGATLTLSAILPQIQFTSPATLVNGILGGGIFYGSTNFATCTASVPYTVQPLESYTAGDLGQLVSNSTLNLEPSGSQSLVTTTKSINSLNLTGSTDITMSGSGSLALTTGGLIGNTLGTITGGTLGAANGDLFVDTVQHLTISSVISASWALVKTGSAALTLTSSSPISGNTYLNQGTLEYAPTGNVTYGGVISGVGNLLMSGTGKMLTLSAVSSYTGSTTVTGGTLCINGSLAGGGPVNLQSGTVLTGGGSIMGNVTATGATIVQNAGAYIAGSVALNSGTLTVGQAGSGGCLNVGGGINISGSSSVVAGSTAATLSGNLDYTSNSSTTFSGDIVGPKSSVTLNSSPSTVLTLSGTNQYGGGTFIQGGTLKTTNSSALGNGALAMTGGTLDLDGSPVLLLASLSGSGTITNSANGTCTLTVSPAVDPATAFSGGITNGNGIVALMISDPAVDGLILSGSDSYTGGTTVLGGTLYLESPDALRPGTSLTVGAAATLAFESAPAAATPVPEPGMIVLLFAAIVAGTLRVPSAHCGRHFRTASSFIRRAVLTLRRRLHGLPISFAQGADGKVAGTLRVPSAHCGRHSRKASSFIRRAVITLRRRLHGLPISFAQGADGKVAGTLRVPSAHCGRHSRTASSFIRRAVITLRRRLHGLPISFAQGADGTRSVPATLR